MNEDRVLAMRSFLLGKATPEDMKILSESSLPERYGETQEFSKEIEKKKIKLEDELRTIDETVEQMKKEEYITACDRIYQDLIPQLNFIEAQLKESKDDEKLKEIVITIENLVSGYEIAVPEEKKEFNYETYVSLRDSGKTHGEIKEIAPAQYGFDDMKLLSGFSRGYGRRKSSKIVKKPTPEEKNFNYEVYKELRKQGKTHDEIKKLAKKDFGFDNSKKLAGFSGNYKRYVGPKEREIIEGELPQEKIDKIGKGQYNTTDFILDHYHSGIPKEVISKEFVKRGLGKNYRSITASAAVKLKSLEKKAQDRKPVEISNGCGRKLYVDSHGSVHIDLEEANKAKKGYK